MFSTSYTILFLNIKKIAIPITITATTTAISVVASETF
jgi:hypothetical protein